MRVLRLLAVLCVAAFTLVSCAGRTSPLSAATAKRPLAPPSQAPSTAADAPPRTEGLAAVRAVVTGVLLRRDDHVEICPGSVVGACPGIRVVGTVEDAWISEPDHVAVWRLAGVYDGTKLVLEAPARPTTLTAEPDYRNSCAEFQEVRKGVNPDSDLAETVGAFVSEHAERVAGHWWDRERQTMVIWVTGEPSELNSRIAKRAPGARVCVQGQARYSQAELERLRAKADLILRERGVVWSGSFGDVTRNVIAYDADTIDAETIAELKRETGDAIQVDAFIELTEHALAQLPVPAPRGDVELVTSRSRSGAGMSALGRFAVRYDAQQRCVYFEAEGGRTLPVWPFGYWATSSPLKIYDHDGNLVAQEGAALELGGGMVDIEHAGANNACGAKRAWIGWPQDPTPGLRR